MINTLAVLLGIAKDDPNGIILTEKGREIQFLIGIMNRRTLSLPISSIVAMGSQDIREKRKELMAPNSMSIRYLIKRDQVVLEKVRECTDSEERKQAFISLLADSRDIVDIVLEHLNNWKGRSSYDALLYCTSKLKKDSMWQVGKAIIGNTRELPPSLLNRLSCELTDVQKNFILESIGKQYPTILISRSTLTILSQNLSIERILSFNWDDKLNYFKTELIHMKGFTRSKSYHIVTIDWLQKKV